MPGPINNPSTPQPVPVSHENSATSVGTMGEHTVTLGNHAPLRLDKIQGNSLPFQGFRTATRIQSAEKGMQNNATATLRAMTRPGGTLNPKDLLGGTQSLSNQPEQFHPVGEHARVPG